MVVVMRSSLEPSFIVPLRPLHCHGMIHTYKQFSVATSAVAMHVLVAVVLAACIGLVMVRCRIYVSSMTLLADLYGPVC